MSAGGGPDLRLAPHAVLLRRSATELQVGVEPSVVVPPAYEPLLRALADGTRRLEEGRSALTRVQRELAAAQAVATRAPLVTLASGHVDELRAAIDARARVEGLASGAYRPEVRTGTPGNARPSSSAVRRAPVTEARSRRAPQAGHAYPAAARAQQQEEREPRLPLGAALLVPAHREARQPTEQAVGQAAGQAAAIRAAREWAA